MIAPPRMPVYFHAPERPPPHRPIRVDPDTTASRLVLRTVFADVRRTLPAGVLTVAHQIGEALVPVVMGLAIDRAVATGDWSATLRWIVVLAAVFAMLSIGYRFGSRIGYLGMNTVQHRLRTQVTDRILDPRGFRCRQPPGALLSIATADVQRLAMTVALGLYPVGELAAIIFCGAVLVAISWPLGILVLLGAPAMLWCLDKAGGSLRSRSETEQRTAADAAGTAADLVTGLRVVKGIHAEAEAGRRHRAASGRALAAVIGARRSEGAYVAAMEAVAALFVVVIGVFAGLQAVDGSLTVGQLITVVGLTQVVMAPLQAMGTNVGKVWVAGTASAARVLTVLQAPFARDGGTRDLPDDDAVPVRITGPLGADGRPVDLEFPAAGVTAVLCDAETTAAATTLLARTVPPTGTATVGSAGVDLYDLSESAALASVRVAPHDGALLEGTVAENVALGGASDRVAPALVAAACDDVVEALPHGLQTQVGEAGRLLSGGQRQRVALARALASTARTLVLVNPTSAVDSVTESVIADRLGASRPGLATVVFTSSPTLIAAADTVLAVNADGRVEVVRSTGTPDRGATSDSEVLG
ncbi:ABC transporter transmembrane domain-containing protein [Gordonia shandongensis]|uniref:ABC transporter transmembrane domain-containing protein n=1 Tax=Gordonia shandongensis TaxID=376351 RepID=UPI00040F0940|nr:ABC transporter ATP-binding protein [Gordonia shandongensis]